MKYHNIWTLLIFSTMICCSCANNESNTESLPVSTQQTEQSDTEEQEGTVEPEEPVIIEDVAFAADTPYGNAEHYMEIVGIKQYNRLESDLYTDVPADGNVFLVIFLSHENYTDSGEYFNPAYLSASVDGAEISTTTLVNDPEGFQTFFANLPGNSTYCGYLAWEVPIGWQNIDICYSGWEYRDSVDIHMSITPDGLFDPVQKE